MEEIGLMVKDTACLTYGIFDPVISDNTVIYYTNFIYTSIYLQEEIGLKK